MRAYIIKHKGKAHQSNMYYDRDVTFLNDDKIYIGILFFKKKDAKKYLDTIGGKEYYEVVGVTVDNSKQDNRYKNKLK